MVLRNFWIYQGGAKGDWFKGGVVIDNDRIIQVFQGEPPDIPIHGGVIDGHGKILLPSHTNCHTHVYSTFARGLALDPFHPTSFRELLEQLWWRLDQKLNEEDVYYSGLVYAMDLIRSGVSAFVDHHASPSCIKGSLKSIYKAMVEVCGLRGLFSYETTDRYGSDKTDESIEENLDFHTWVQDHAIPFRASSLFGLHASFTLEDHTLKRVGECHLPVHIHVAEGQEDALIHKERFGMSAIDRLNHFGLIRPGCLLAHCIHVDQKDLDIIADQGGSIVINPQSNMNNGVGLAQAKPMNDRGITVLLGNDGYGSDITRDMRTLLLAQHHLAQSPTTFGLDDLYHIAWEKNPQYLSGCLGIPLGKIEPGYAADLVTYSYIAPTPIHADNFGGHFFFGIMEHHHPVDLIVGGKYLMENGEFTLPLIDIFNDAQKWSQKLWDRLKKG